MTNDLNLTPRSLTADEQSRSSISLMRRLAPEMGASMAAYHNAWEMAQSPDFLVPDWAALSPITVLTVRQAVALVCGINQRFAAVTEHQVGEGAARAAIDDVRGLLDYLAVKRGTTPATKIPLDSMAEWMRDLGRALPVGFPGAVVAAPRIPQPEPKSPAWEVREPRKHQGYSIYLYRHLKAAHGRGDPLPTAHHVLEAWSENQPLEFAAVNVDSFDYSDATGRRKTATRSALRKSIKRMTSTKAAPK